MASKATTYTRGEMDIQAQAATFELVMKLVKWGSLAVAVLVLFPTLWFCTGAGFPGAAISSLVVLVLGVVFLREKAGAH
jgi:hypothetical protein